MPISERMKKLISGAKKVLARRRAMKDRPRPVDHSPPDSWTISTMPLKPAPEPVMRNGILGYMRNELFFSGTVAVEGAFTPRGYTKISEKVTRMTFLARK